MKHSIRQRVINAQGFKTVKVVKVDGELGSKVCDKNGREIFEGDLVKNRHGEIEVVKFSAATFMLGIRDLCEFDESDLEVVGHAED